MFLLYALLVSIPLGILNGYYWTKQGYPGLQSYFLGTIGIFGLISMVFKFIGIK